MRNVRHNIKIALPGKNEDAVFILDYSGEVYTREEINKISQVIEQGLIPGIYAMTVVTQILEDGARYDEE